EGEFAYMAQLFTRGIPLYEKAHNLKLPGIYLAYAAIMGVLGETKAAIHLGLVVVNATATVGLYLLARSLLKTPLAALAAAFVFGTLSLLSPYLGTAAHATQ